MAVLELEKTKVEFPADEIEACIRDAVASQAADQALLRPHVAVAAAAGGSWEPEIDSLVVVEIICSIEELIGIPLPASFAPRGGYHSVDECVEDLVSATQSVWIAHNKEERDHGQ
jgi:acyl carrier protein